MNFKNKIIAAALVALVAGAGIFGSNVNRANAENATSTLSIGQLEQMVMNLQRQIAELIQLINQKNHPHNKTDSCGKQGDIVAATSTAAATAKCCAKLSAINNASSTVSYVCAKCGNGSCGKGETNANCPADCPIVIGGGCVYKKFAGKCTVSKIEDASTTINVNYSFSPTTTPDISGTYLTATSTINPYGGTAAAGYLGLPCLKNKYAPTLNQTTECGLIAGAIFNCTLSVIKTGACTPINVEFKSACYGEGEGVTGNTTSVLSCCAGLVSAPRTTCTGNVCATQEGFVCSKSTPKSCSFNNQCSGKICTNKVCCNANQCGDNKTCYNKNATTTIDGIIKTCDSEGKWLRADEQTCSTNSQCGGNKCINRVCCKASQCGNGNKCYDKNATTTLDGVVKACAAEGKWSRINAQSCVLNSQCVSGKCANGSCCNANQCGNNKTCYDKNATTTIDGVVRVCAAEGRWLKK